MNCLCISLEVSLLPPLLLYFLLNPQIPALTPNPAELAHKTCSSRSRTSVSDRNLRRTGCDVTPSGSFHSLKLQHRHRTSGAELTAADRLAEEQQVSSQAGHQGVNHSLTRGLQHNFLFDGDSSDWEETLTPGELCVSITDCEVLESVNIWPAFILQPEQHTSCWLQRVSCVTIQQESENK